MMTPQHAFEIARKQAQRDPELERVIGSCPEYAYQYARHVLNGRWPEAEDVIASNSVTAYKYGRHVLRGNWSSDVLHLCPEWLYEYVQDVCGGKIPDDLQRFVHLWSFDDKRNRGWFYEQLKKLLTPPAP
jgi:hypothetical protein